MSKKLKYILAGLGVFYLVVAAAYGAWKAIEYTHPSSPSELAMHPERQAENLAEQRAGEMAQRLDLSESQMKELEQIMRENPPGPPPGGGPGEWRPRNDGLREKLKTILTPEQRAKMDAMPMGPGGPGGPGRRGGPGGPFGMSDEKKSALMGAMSPEQKARFEKELEEMAKRRPMGLRGPGQGPPAQGVR